MANGFARSSEPERSRGRFLRPAPIRVREGSPSPPAPDGMHRHQGGTAARGGRQSAEAEDLWTCARTSGPRHRRTGFVSQDEHGGRTLEARSDPPSKAAGFGERAEWPTGDTDLTAVLPEGLAERTRAGSGLQRVWSGRPFASTLLGEDRKHSDMCWNRSPSPVGERGFTCLDVARRDLEHVRKRWISSSRRTRRLWARRCPA